MQIFTIEQQKRHNIYYRVTLNEAGAPIRKEKFDCRVTRLYENGVTYFLVLDKDGTLRQDAYKYLNVVRMNMPQSTRVQAATAIGLFHTFCDLACLDPSNLNSEDIHRFIDFLHGTTVHAEEGSKPLFRNPKTINSYYGMVKKYLKYKGWSKEAVSQTVSVKRETPIGDISIQIKAQKDIHTVHVDREARFHTPMHLTIEQIQKLADAILKENDIRSYILMKLQVCYGLRRGECLGLTLEDMKKEIDGDTVQYKLYLRNRVSDQPFQSCKRLYHPQNIQEYPQMTDMLHWEINVDENLYKLIEKYYRDSRSTRKNDAKRLERIKLETAADNVEVNKFGIAIEPNYYIFIGDNGRLLSGQTWNNHLKHYFEKVGIPVDKGSKKTNCSHRLRHSFAMFLSTYSSNPANAEQLRISMRHSSVVSGDAYFTPTDEEQLELKQKFLDEMFKVIPSLSKFE